MARRRSGASRSSSSRSRSSARGGSSRAGSARGASSARARTDGRVDVACPQCGAGYRVTAEMLEEKLECSECHRVFFPKTTAGRRVQKPDYTKAYVGFGVAAVVIILTFVLMSQGGDKPKKQQQVVENKGPEFTRGSHPRASQLSAWAQSLSSNNQLVLTTHSNLSALAAQLGIEQTDPPAVMAALQTHESTELLRTMDCSSAELASEEDMTASSGKGRIYVTPKSGDDRFKRNTNGIFEVAFDVEGSQVKVRSFELKLAPIYAPGKQPGIVTYTPNEDIAKPELVEVSDSAGTRKVKESEPAPVPHWKDATPELRQLADEVVAGILEASAPDAPGGLFNRATLKVRTDDQKKAAVPRVLDAMNTCYKDVIANQAKLILLDRALYQWTGYAVNYPSMSSGDAAKDKQRRESCIRQWFAFWYRYHEDLSEFFDKSENLEGEGEGDGGE